jgi:hypothetical protein
MLRPTVFLIPSKLHYTLYIQYTNKMYTEHRDSVIAISFNRRYHYEHIWSPNLNPKLSCI